MLQSPAEHRSICGTVVSSSPVWCSISTAPDSAAAARRGAGLGPWSEKDVHSSGSRQRPRLSPGTQVRRPRQGPAAEHGRAVLGPKVAPPWSSGSRCHHSLIVGSERRRGSECWPLQLRGEGHWTRFCKERQIKMNQFLHFNTPLVICGVVSTCVQLTAYPKTMPSSFTWTLVWPFKYSASILLLK